MFLKILILSILFGSSVSAQSHSCGIQAVCEFEYSCNDYLHACDNPGEKKISWAVQIKTKNGDLKATCFQGETSAELKGDSSIHCLAKQTEEIRINGCVMSTNSILKTQDSGQQSIELRFGGMGGAKDVIVCNPSKTQPSCRCPAGKKK